MSEAMLREICEHIESVNYRISNGCIDHAAFYGMKNEDELDHNKVMETFCEKLQAAYDAIDELLIEFYETTEEKTDVIK